MEGELTGSSRLGRQQRDGGVAVMRKSSPRDMAAACSISGRRSPAASAALGPWQDQPFKMHQGHGRQQANAWDTNNIYWFTERGFHLAAHVNAQSTAYTKNQQEKR
jgi:hypothetical protein